MADKPTYEELEQKIERLTETFSNNEDSLREIQKLAKIGNWEWNIEQQILTWSDEVYHIFGLDTAEFKPSVEAFEATIHPDDREDFLKQREAMLNAKKEACIDHRIVLPDGSVRYVQERTQLIFNNQNEICRVIGTVQDITERRQAEETLRDSEEKYQNLIKNSYDIVYSTTSDGIITFASPQIDRFGYETEDVISKQFLEFVVPEQRQEVMNSFEKGMRDNTSCPTEFQWVGKDGNRHWVEAVGKILYDDSENPLSQIGVLRDIDQRKRAEEQLRQSEENYRILIENANESILVTNINGKVQLINKSAASDLGGVPENYINKTIWDIYPKEIADKRISDSLKVFQSGKGHLKETSRLLQGKMYHFLISRQPIKNDSGEVIFVLTLATDITDRKLAEEALMESEEKYRRLFDESIACVYLFDEKKHFLDSNQAGLDLLGYSREELLNMSITDVDADPIVVLPVHEQLLSGDRIINYEHQLKRKDGKVVTVLNNSSPLTNYDEQVVGMHSTLIDISQHKQAEKALQISEIKYRSILEAMKDAVYICSPEFRLEYMNPRMISRTGRDAVGEACYKAIYNFEKRCSWCILDQVQQGEHVEYELADPLDKHYYSITNSPILNSNGLISQLTIFRDITEHKQLEEQLRQAHKMEAVGTLTGGIAHDFNNLLYMITGNAELALEDTPEWNPSHINLQEIKSAALRGAGIVRQLLAYTRKTGLKLKPTGIMTVIKDSLKLLRATIPATIEIRKNIPVTDVTILADPVQINQIMMNLCINASQEMEETGGILEISVDNVTLDENAASDFPDQSNGDYVTVAIRDTGSGIEPDIIDRIFDPYFTTKEVGKGSGMGLSVVHGIVKNHNGAITVESELGKGTTFTFLFPVIDEKPEIEVKIPGEVPLGHETILFVDDEKSIVHMTGQVLERLGYKVETKLNPVEALELFKADPEAFDMVITDMTMPQMTGVKLSGKLKAIRPDIPVILCTGHSSLIDEEKAKEMGIDGYVMKPIVKREIAKTIREVLDKRQGK